MKSSFEAISMAPILNSPDLLLLGWDPVLHPATLFMTSCSGEIKKILMYVICIYEL